jgi:arylsulfatase A-like enzyme
MKDEALKRAMDSLILKAGMTPVMQGSCYVMHPEALQAVIDKAIKQALAAPTSADYAMGYAEGFNDGCKPAPVQEPVAWRWTNGKGWLTYGEMPHDRFESTPLYTTPPAAPMQDVDWKDMYEKQKRRSEMWVAKYEKDIGPLEYAAPLAAPVQEPVAWRYDLKHAGSFAGVSREYSPIKLSIGENWTPLYTTPPAAQRQWTGLTDEEIQVVLDDPQKYYDTMNDFARAIEAKLKEKNA